MILIIVSIIDLGMPVYSWTTNDTYQAVINSHWLSQGSFWFLIGFYAFRLLISIASFLVWRKEFKALYNTLNPCFNPSAAGAGGMGSGAGVSLTGRRSGSGNGDQEESKVNTFVGTGT